VLNTVVEERLIGGVDTYKRLCPNATFCTDGFICRVGFMDLDDAKSFISQITESSFFKGGSPTGDFIIVDSALGLTSHPSWLVFGNYQGVPVVCLKGTEQTKLFIPETEINSTFEAISVKDLKEMYDFVGVQAHVEHYVHKVTGRHIYIGRTGQTGSTAIEQVRTNVTGKPSEQRSSQLWKRIASHFKRHRLP